MTPREQILTAVLNCRRDELGRRSARLSVDQQRLYDRLLARYESGEPLQYVIGFTDFCNSRVFVNPRVLIPRPETEILVEHLAKRINSGGARGGSRVLDLGTGSGNIAIALAMACPRAQVTAVDVSPPALELARHNAVENGVSGQIRFVCEDMAVFCKTLGGLYGPYDVIVSNPPYVPTPRLGELPADVRREPRLALDGGPDGLRFYRYLLEFAPPCLAPGGFMAFEIGDGMLGPFEALLGGPAAGSWSLRTIADYTGTARHIILEPCLKTRNPLEING
jgi:release factor glutamine methyltransferase